MVEYRVISGKDFLRAKPTGEIDLEESKKILASIASITKPPADYEILLDIRQANHGSEKETYFNAYEVLEFVREISRNRSAFRNKIAVVCREGKQLDNAEFMKLCATNRGFLVRVFTCYEEAVEWLTIKIEV